MSDVSAVVKYFSTANEGFQTTAGADVASGATTVSLTSTAGLTDGSVFVGIIEPGVVNKQQVFTGTVDVTNTRITNVVWTRGTNTLHATGSTIVDFVTGTDWNMMSTGIRKQHNQDGSHGDVTANSVSTNTLTVGGTNITNLTPTGTVTMFAGPSAPTGWLICDGSSLLRSSYSALFAVIGTTYGAADGTHFTLPDLRGRTAFGKDGTTEFAALGTSGGQKDVKAHSHGVSDAGHSHGVNDPGHTHYTPNGVVVVGSSTLHLAGSGFEAVTYGNVGTSGAGTGIWLSGSGANVSVQSSGSGATNLNPYLTLNYIIKS